MLTTGAISRAIVAAALAATTLTACTGTSDGSDTTRPPSTDAPPSTPPAHSAPTPGTPDAFLPSSTAEGGILFHEMPAEGNDLRMSGLFDLHDGCLTGIDPDTGTRYPVSLLAGSTVKDDRVSMPDGSTIEIGVPFHSSGVEIDDEAPTGEARADGATPSSTRTPVARIGLLDDVDGYAQKCGLDQAKVSRFLWVHGDLTPANGASRSSG